jgi:hypothetical protein
VSDIDDILGEFDNAAPSTSGGGIGRYIPDPAEFGSAYRQASQSGWDNLASAGSDIWNKGAGPVNVGKAAMAGLEYLASPFTAVGKYLGGPVERGITDMGYPNVGKVAGDTVALAPAMMAPFPGASAIRAIPEGMGMVMGEFPAASAAASGLATRLGARGAPAAAASSDVDNILEEFEPATRMTSKMKNVKDLESEIAQKGIFEQMLGKDTSFPAPGGDTPGNVRLLHKGNPKVGEKKYSGDVLEGYEPEGKVLTFRTSHVPKPPAEPTADEMWPKIESQLPWKLPEGQVPAEQTPLRPGVAKRLPEGMVDVQRMEEMYMPNVRERAQPDPLTLAELKLKYGGGSPQGGDMPPWMQQQTAGIKPVPVPFPGAQNMAYPARPPSQPNVMFPAGDPPMPVPMGVEARQNVNRLRGDLGLPQDAAEAQRVAREPLPQRTPIEEPPLTPARAEKDVTKYGDIEVGQPYDIVMKMGADEMRSTGGTVTELLYKNEPVVESGKTVVRPVGYAVLEDGRQVPVKLLQPSGSAQPNMRMSAPGSAPVQNIGSKGQPKPLTPEEQAALASQADPAFKNVQQAMASRTGEAVDPKDVASVQKAIKQALSAGKGAKVTFTQLRDAIPGVSNTMLNKAIDGFKGTRDANIIRQSEKGTSENFILRRKLSEEEKAAANRASSQASKKSSFDNGLKAIRSEIKEPTTYLRNFSSTKMGDKGQQISNSEIATRFNQMIDSGQVRIIDEATGKEVKKINPGMISSLDDDYLLTFQKKAKPKDPDLVQGVAKELKGKKSSNAKAVEKLTAEYNNGDITGTEFLSALKALEKKPKGKK